ncbi:MAG: hypothetical protein K8L99_33800 [Anaerolineae bacterium]|nr:hypothetical protein [Anaerolineae bacterium]
MNIADEDVIFVEAQIEKEKHRRSRRYARFEQVRRGNPNKHARKVAKSHYRFHLHTHEDLPPVMKFRSFAEIRKGVPRITWFLRRFRVYDQHKQRWKDYRT